MTTVIVTPTIAVPTGTGSVSYSLYQGSSVGTATELASSALPTQLIFDSKAGGAPVGFATTGNAATMSVSPVLVGTADVAKSVIATSTSSPIPTQTAILEKAEKLKPPVLAIVLGVVGVVIALSIAMLFCFIWSRNRSRKRKMHRRAQSEEFGNAPPAGGVIRKLGQAYEKSPSAADPFSDIHASEPPTDPFADPEKPAHGHARAGSDSFMSMGPPRAPYTHQPSASTGSTESGRAKKREMEEARRKDMAALNNLVPFFICFWFLPVHNSPPLSPCASTTPFFVFILFSSPHMERIHLH
ncbi:hypothetical protein RSOLAG1IB_01070 [Rhizoctonia solani AG-1 IB]|uniref:SKG6 domain-containing protein n=1 Tax=Thanatephorus cucumeris (strain AG1-IB / isolate 7/3/14) TaxID=1108050 RepID=A0A0B7FFW9_THACB|nr:hypothetical protein RSOLAG1IB_01070 [Rhizoctonia solani AG-1 IB]